MMHTELLRIVITVVRLTKPSMSRVTVELGVIVAVLKQLTPAAPAVKDTPTTYDSIVKSVELPPARALALTDASPATNRGGVELLLRRVALAVNVEGNESDLTVVIKLGEYDTVSVLETDLLVADMLSVLVADSVAEYGTSVGVTEAVNSALVANVDRVAGLFRAAWFAEKLMGRLDE